MNSSIALRLGAAVAVLLAVAGCSGTAAPSDSAASTTVLTPPGSVLDGTLVYQNGGRIRLVNTDGSDERLLAETPGGGEQLHPDWSPDGGSVVFAVDDADGTRDLWIASVDGRDPRRIVDCAAPCVWADEPAWSHDGESIAFERGTEAPDGSGIGTLERTDLAAANADVLVTFPPSQYPFGPRWSPDDSRLVVEVASFATPAVSEGEIVGSVIAVADAAMPTANVTELTDMAERATTPDWHPTEDRLIFGLPADPSRANGAADLVVMNADGTGRRVVTDFAALGARAIQVTWSPDGSRLVFVHEDQPGTSPMMVTTLPDGTDLQPIAGHGNSSGTHPRLHLG